MITVSAPGKIHLLGEHAVVYGKPAILAAIERRVFVGIRKSENILIDSPYGDKLVRQAVEVFKKAFSIDELPPLEIKINSQLSVGSGLGSSAAVSAATIGALMKFVKNIWNPVRLNELTYEVEKIAHGNPSGADNTAVIFGGLVWFRREFDFLKSIWSLPVSSASPPASPNRGESLGGSPGGPVSSYKIPQFVLLDSGTPKETTKEMVSGVAKLYKSNRRRMEEVFNDQEQQTKRLLLALRNDDRRQLISTIRCGERNLEKMGVVSLFTKKIIREIEGKGGAAKVCGGGGRKERSGILLCYHEKPSVIVNLGEKHKLSVYRTKLGGEGIRIE